MSGVGFYFYYDLIYMSRMPPCNMFVFYVQTLEREIMYGIDSVFVSSGWILFTLILYLYEYIYIQQQ